MSDLARLDDAAHRFLHRDPSKCVTPERAEQIAAAGGYPGVICMWGAFGKEDSGAGLAAALEAAGLRAVPNEEAP